MASGLSREAREQIARAYGAMLEQVPSVEQIAFHTGDWERASAAPFRVPREQIEGTMTGRLYVDFGRAPEEPWGDGRTWTNVGITDGGVTITPIFADHTVDDFVTTVTRTVETSVDLGPAPDAVRLSLADQATADYIRERDNVRLAQLAAYREASQQDRHIRENPSYYDHRDCGVCNGDYHAGDGARPVTWSRVMGLPEPWPLVITESTELAVWHAALLSQERRMCRQAYLVTQVEVS